MLFSKRISQVYNDMKASNNLQVGVIKSSFDNFAIIGPPVMVLVVVS